MQTLICDSLLRKYVLIWLESEGYSSWFQAKGHISLFVSRWGKLDNGTMFFFLSAFLFTKSQKFNLPQQVMFLAQTIYNRICLNSTCLKSFQFTLLFLTWWRLNNFDQQNIHRFLTFTHLPLINGKSAENAFKFL